VKRFVSLSLQIFSYGNLMIKIITQLILIFFLIPVFCSLSGISNQTSAENENAAMSDQAVNRYHLRSEDLAQHRLLWESWRYHPGDDPQWAEPDFDDSDWEITNTFLSPHNLPASGWDGIGWFRLHLTVDSMLVNKPLILDMWLRGAAEVYLNGELIAASGTVGYSEDTEIPGRDRSPKKISFGPETDNIIAVRYSNRQWERILDMGYGAGFQFTVADVEWYIVHRTDAVRETTIRRIFFTAIPLSLALLHILLFLYYPPFRENLYYSLTMLGFAGITFFSFSDEHIITAQQQIRYGGFAYVFRGFTLAFLTLTLYYLLRRTFPRYIYVIAGVTIAIGIWGYLRPFGLREDITNIVMAMVLGLLLFEMFRHKSQHAYDLWIIKAGFILLIITVAYQYLVMYNIINPVAGVVETYIYGVLALSASMSIYLSRKFGRVNRDLELQLVNVKNLSAQTIEQERKAKGQEIERRLLEADNLRKTKELEDARKLQLSMLPQDVPRHPGLQIAVYMKTATEVGGDYYDFHTNDDGILTVAIGDATGHGTRAGIMVTIAKTLFYQLAGEKDIIRIFHTFTESIKTLKLDQLYMGLTLAKFTSGAMSISAAGMPPVYIYRSATDTVDEIKIKGMPLGSFSDFPYQQRNVRLFAGDTILLMSDGFPEMFNPKKEIFDYPRVQSVFARIGRKSPEDIIQSLAGEADLWMNGKPQDDDITFVVIRVKSL
jgi:serine phosphatase RsbU (regulator of sigma subunit)